MGEVTVVDEVADKEIEAAQLAELDRMMNIITGMQKSFLGDVQKPGELTATDGRRCMLVIELLKYHSHAYYFQVSEAGVTLVEPYETYDTAIIAPLESVFCVLKATVAGADDPFGDEWSRGRAKLRGQNRFHDGVVFRDIFKRLAARIRRYKQAMRSA